MSHDGNTMAEFNALLQKADKSLVDFHATWCGPCVRIAPTVVSKAQENGINLIKVDVDQNGEAAQKYGVQAMPTFCVIDRHGTLIFSKCGGSEAVVNECIAKCK